MATQGNKVSFHRLTAAQLDSFPIDVGQIIFVPETNSLYIDAPSPLNRVKIEGSNITYDFTQDSEDGRIIIATASNKDFATIIDIPENTKNDYSSSFYPVTSFSNNIERVFIDQDWGKTCILNGNCIWKEGEHIYYSDSSYQYEFNKATNTLVNKTWNGYTSIRGYSIWTDGDNIYYSSSAQQKILNKSTDTWENKTWNGLTKFYGQAIWTDGDNIYYSNSAQQYVLDKTTSTWESKTWNGFTDIIGAYIWTDGTNIYYSYDGIDKVLDKTTSTWNNKNWNGLDIDLNGGQIWTHNNNIYYSNIGKNYQLNKETSTWIPLPELDIYCFQGSNMWTDGVYLYNMAFPYIYKFNEDIKEWSKFDFTSAPDIIYNFNGGTLNPYGHAIWNYKDKIYFFNGSTGSTAILDKTTNTWKRIPMVGKSFSNIWTDGQYLYHNNNLESSVFNEKTYTWENKIWNNLPSTTLGSRVWTDGENIYYSSSSDKKNYILDKTTSTWTEKVWNFDNSISSGSKCIEGASVWTDGENIYAQPYLNSSSSTHFILDKTTETWNLKTWNGVSNLDASCIWTDGINIYYSKNGEHKVLDKTTSTWNTVDMGNLNFNGKQVWSDGQHIYISTSNIQKKMVIQYISTNGIINQKDTINDFNLKNINDTIGNINNVLSQLVISGGNS